MTTKYKAGDIVEVRLDERDIEYIECGHDHLVIELMQIKAHHPSPEPVVRWVNVYSDSFGYYFRRRKDADSIATSNRTCVLRFEWADGDTSKKPTSITMEDV